MSKIFGIKKYQIQFEEFFLQKSLGFVCLKHGFIKFGIDMGTDFKTFPFFDSIGFSIEKIWYRKKVLYSAPFRFWVSSHTD